MLSHDEFRQQKGDFEMKKEQNRYSLHLIRQNVPQFILLVIFSVLPQNKVAEIDHASYLVTLPASAAAALDAYNAAENAMVVKKTKRGQKELDLKTIIPHVEYEQAGEQLQFNLVLPCGSGEAPNYNPALLLGYLQQQYNIPPWLCSVLRTKLYTKNNEEFC